MPFKKVGNDSYTSPSGRHFNGAQVRLYYANGGHFPGEKGYAEGGMVGYAKGGDIAVAGYAAGGPVLGRTRDFLKEQVEFRDPDEGECEKPGVVGDTADADQLYAKEGAGKGNGMGPGPSAKRTGDKSLKVIKPRG